MIAENTSIDTMKEDNIEEIERDSDGSEHSASGSGDSSDEESDLGSIDEEECIRKKQGLIIRMQELDSRILFLQECIFKQKFYALDVSRAQVLRGEAPEYVHRIREFEKSVQERLEIAEVIKRLKLKSIDTCWDAEAFAADQDHKDQSTILFEEFKERLQGEIERLDEYRYNVDLNTDLWLAERNSSLRTTGRRRRQLKKKRKDTDTSVKKKPFVVSGPCVVYRLKESEILEDWTFIRKAISDAKRRHRN